ncbi:MAG: uridylate kinase [Candidatus Nanohaloarchaea archaeon]|jgi:uridylate kinase
MTKVFAVSGSIIRNKLDEIGEFAESINQNSEQIVVVTGAGGLSKYQKAVEGNKGEKDLIGIKATRLHAQTLITEIDNTYPEVPEKPEEVQKAASTGKNVVTGGLVPGYSTDAVAATVAELLDAELYIATRVDGIYSADPEKDDSAKKFDSITTDKLLELAGGRNEPGTYSVVDEAAIRLIERSNISTKVFYATNENIVDPEQAEGTEIEPSNK